MAKSKRKLPKYVSAYVDPWGTERFKFRKTGCSSCYLPPVGSAEFPAAYEAALANVLVGAGRARPRSVGDLLPRWYATNAFRKAGATRQARAKGILEPFREDFKDRLVASFKWDHIEAVVAARAPKRRDEKSGRTVGGTAAANNLKKELARVFDLAVKLDWIQFNPCDHAEGVHHTRVGFHNWTEQEIGEYRETHAVGTYARAALEIILWTGQRRGDASQFGPAHLKGGKIKFMPAKTVKIQTVQWLDAAPPLVEAIDALPAIGTKTFLITSFGAPYTVAGFGNKMREWCNEAGLPHCSAHGLRKAAARRVAENGGTQQELMAFGGWANDKDAAPYVRDANKAQMAGTAVARVVAFDRKERGVAAA